MSSVTLIHGDTLKLLTDEAGFRHPVTGKLLKADAVITDPPYAIDFSGSREWDSFGITSAVAARPGHAFERWCNLWARPLFTDVMLPGAHIFAFSSERTMHRITSGIEDAGFEIIGSIAWIYATGQVKSKDRPRPAFEPIVIGRKNSDDKTLTAIFKKDGRGLLHAATLAKEDGRHPSNLIVQEGVETDEELRGGEFFYVAKASVKDRDYGCTGLILQKKIGGIFTTVMTCGACGKNSSYVDGCITCRLCEVEGQLTPAEAFPVSKKESTLSGISTRCEGCEDLQKNVSKNVLDESCEKCGGKLVYTGGLSGASGEARNFHPTPKPINLMRRIIRLTTRPGHTIIDPFSGSFTTGVAAILEGRNFIGIEREEEYMNIGKYRIAQALRDTGDNEQADKLLGEESNG